MSELRGRGPGPIAVDLTSHGCGVDVPALTTGSGAGPSPVPWVSLGQSATGSTHLPAQQLLEGTLSNVASLRVDTAGACLHGDITYRVTSAGPAVLHLADGRDIVLADGLNAGVSRAPGDPSTAVVAQPAPSQRAANRLLRTAAVRRPAVLRHAHRPTAAAGRVLPSQTVRTLAFTGASRVLEIGAAALPLLALLILRLRRAGCRGVRRVAFGTSPEPRSGQPARSLPGGLAETSRAV